MPPTDVDLLDPRMFRNGPPHDTFALLRREAPVFLHRRPNRPPFWVLTRHEDVVRVSRDWASFSSRANGALLDEQPPPRQGASPLLSMDPPEHTALRGLVGEGFTPPAADRLARRARTLCGIVLDRVSERGECDFVSDIAAEFSLAPLAELLGFPDADERRRVARLARVLSDPLEQLVPEAAAGATMEIFRFAGELASSGGGGAGDVLLKLLAGGHEDGEGLTRRQFELFFLLLVTAGHVTTQHLMSGGMLALLQNPWEWLRLVENPGVLETGVDELMRWVSPVMQLQRTATRDVEIAGRPVARDDRIALYYVAANRDEAVFEDADRLDLGRAPNPHIAFGGGGPHNCLGEHMARLLTRTLFEEIARRMPDIAPVDHPDHLGSTFLNGVRSMPVRFTPTPALRGRSA
ncbi:cytochrome P450 [Microbispora sp. NBC_01189]|uniref:cytochrome P450 n=1 Tax=Microbispora sp. NBC_01189 TaxID=2903583 RepID=UPI002E1373DB|nr:cytochrome P450 [Microbispora sp. NBC_01189]